jgi:hypothetical protein
VKGEGPLQKFYDPPGEYLFSSDPLSQNLLPRCYRNRANQGNLHPPPVHRPMISCGPRWLELGLERFCKPQVGRFDFSRQLHKFCCETSSLGTPAWREAFFRKELGRISFLLFGRGGSRATLPYPLRRTPTLSLNGTAEQDSPHRIAAAPLQKPHSLAITDH